MGRLCGVSFGCLFCEIGVDVTCVDINVAKIEALKQVKCRYEPNLETLVQRNVKSDRLHFSTDLASVLNDMDVVFGSKYASIKMAVDLRYVLEVAYNRTKYDQIFVGGNEVPFYWYDCWVGCYF